MEIKSILKKIDYNKNGWNLIFPSVYIKRTSVFLIFALSLATVLLSLVSPIVSQKLVDEIVSSNAGTSTIIWAALAVISLLLSGYLSNLDDAVVNKLTVFLNIRLSKKIYVHLMKVKHNSLQEQSGKIVNLLNQYQSISTFLLSVVPSVIFNIIGALAALIASLYYDYVVTIIAISYAFIISRYIAKSSSKMGDIAREQFQFKSHTQRLTTETVSNLETIKSNAVESFFYRNWIKSAINTTQAAWRVDDNIRHLNLYIILSSRMISLIVVLVGCLRVLQGDLSIGSLFALQMLISRAVAPLMTAGSAMGHYQHANTIVGELFEFFKHPKERARIVPGLRPNRFGPIKIENLTLRYPKTEKPALDDVSVELPQKGVVAIIGKNGSGKTSLIRTLLALERGYEGTISVGHSDIQLFDPRWLRSKLSVVDQDTALYTGTVKENLCAGITHDITETDIKNALEFASATQFVDQLPNGLDTLLNEGAKNLSGGQRQRLAVARAILKNSDIAIFDEPTSALDAEAAIEMERKLLEWGKQHLVVIVTHHLFTARAANTVIVLDDGKLVGHGTHEELLDDCPIYKKLWQAYVRE